MTRSLQQALNEVGTRPLLEIAAQHGFNADYLRAAASKRGLSTAFYLKNVNKKQWSSAEVQFLRSNAATMSAKQIGNELKRTEVSVKSKAKKLGIKLQKYGENHHLANISNHDVELCRQLSDEELRPFEIAEKMEIEISHVCAILNFRSRLNG